MIICEAISLLDSLHKSVSQEEQWSRVSNVLQGSMTSAFFPQPRFITCVSSTEYM